MDHATIFNSSPMQQLRWSSLWQKINYSWKLLTVVTESFILNMTGLLRVGTPSLFIKKGGGGGGSYFSHKKKGVGKIKVIVFKVGGTTYFHINQPFPMLSFFACLVCLYVFCFFTPFLLVFFVYHRKKLVSLNLINRYVTSTSE